MSTFKMSSNGDSSCNKYKFLSGYFAPFVENGKINYCKYISGSKDVTGKFSERTVSGQCCRSTSINCSLAKHCKKFGQLFEDDEIKLRELQSSVWNFRISIYISFLHWKITVVLFTGSSFPSL